MWALYVRPVYSLFHNISWKVAWALVFLPLTWFADQVDGIFFTTPPELIAVVAVLWVLDLVTGVTKAFRTGGFREISSVGLRQSVVKLVEYAAFVLACDAIASAGQQVPYFSVVFAQVDQLGVLLLCVTEFQSINENLELQLLRRMARIIGGDRAEALLGTDADDDQSSD